MFEVEAYTTEDGKIPVEEFIEGLNKKQQAKTIRDIEILENKGHILREPYSKSIGNGVFELRTKFGSDISRIFYFFRIGNKIILTHGFIKKTQKTPKREIEKALEYKEDYERRH